MNDTTSGRWAVMFGRAAARRVIAADPARVRGCRDLAVTTRRVFDEVSRLVEGDGDGCGADAEFCEGVLACALHNPWEFSAGVEAYVDAYLRGAALCSTRIQ